MSPAFRSRPYSIQIRLQTNCIHFESRSGFDQTSPCPNFIAFESGSGYGFYHCSPDCGYLSRLYQFLRPGLGPDTVRFRILSNFEYGPGPDFIKHVRVRVGIRILPIAYF